MESSSTTRDGDTAHVIAPPPLVYVGGLVVGLLLHIAHPIQSLTHSFALRVLGGCLIVAGLALSGAVMHHFGRAGTPVIPWRETRRLVVSGPYRFSRNPDYLGQALLAAGLGLLFGIPWVLPALVPALIVVRYGIVAREERYLRRRFGDEYRRFCARVPRWF